MCQGVVPPGTPAQRVVVQRRRKVYSFRSRANLVIRWERPKRKREHRDDPGGEGQEIVREVLACPSCAVKNGSG
jgi:hypothetical protein